MAACAARSDSAAFPASVFIDGNERPPSSLKSAIAKAINLLPWRARECSQTSDDCRKLIQQKPHLQPRPKTKESGTRAVSV